jgi:uncharacterized membrane protein YccC
MIHDAFRIFGAMLAANLIGGSFGWPDALGCAVLLLVIHTGPVSNSSAR